MSCFVCSQDKPEEQQIALPCLTHKTTVCLKCFPTIFNQGQLALHESGRNIICPVCLSSFYAESCFKVTLFGGRSDMRSQPHTRFAVHKPASPPSSPRGLLQSGAEARQDFQYCKFPVQWSYENSDGLWKLSTITIAQQLTLHGQRLFALVPLHEFMAVKNWSNPMLAPRLTAVSEHFNRVTFGIQSEIMCGPKRTLAERTNLICNAIKIMEELYKLNNLHYTMAFYAALSSSTILRLKNTFENCPDWAMDIFHRMSAMVSPLNNFKFLRDRMVVLEGKREFCLPYLGMYQNDLVHCSEKQPERLEDLGRKLQQIVRYPFATALEPLLCQQKYLSLVFSTDEDTLFRISEELEPRVAKDHSAHVMLMDGGNDGGEGGSGTLHARGSGRKPLPATFMNSSSASTGTTGANSNQASRKRVEFGGSGGGSSGTSSPVGGSSTNLTQSRSRDLKSLGRSATVGGGGSLRDTSGSPSPSAQPVDGVREDEALSSFISNATRSNQSSTPSSASSSLSSSASGTSHTQIKDSPYYKLDENEALALKDKIAQLSQAASDGNMEALKEVLSQHPNIINEADANGHTVLYQAVRQGYVEIVVELLGWLGLHVDKPVLGSTALHVAAVSPHHGPETLALLLAAGANPNILSASCGLTARQEAMQGAMNDPALMANLDVFTIFEAEGRTGLRGFFPSVQKVTGPPPKLELKSGTSRLKSEFTSESYARNSRERPQRRVIRGVGQEEREQLNLTLGSTAMMSSDPDAPTGESSGGNTPKSGDSSNSATPFGSNSQQASPPSMSLNPRDGLSTNPNIALSHSLSQFSAAGDKRNVRTAPKARLNPANSNQGVVIPDMINVSGGLFADLPRQDLTSTESSPVTSPRSPRSSPHAVESGGSAISGGSGGVPLVPPSVPSLFVIYFPNDQKKTIPMSSQPLQAALVKECMKRQIDFSKFDVQDSKGRNILFLDVPLNELKISAVQLVEKSASTPPPSLPAVGLASRAPSGKRNETGGTLTRKGAKAGVANLLAMVAEEPKPSLALSVMEQKKQYFAELPNWCVALVTRDTYAFDSSPGDRTVTLQDGQTFRLHALVLRCRVGPAINRTGFKEEETLASLARYGLPVLTQLGCFLLEDVVTLAHFSPDEVVQLWRIAGDLALARLHALLFQFVHNALNFNNSIAYALAFSKWNVVFLMPRAIQIIQENCQKLRAADTEAISAIYAQYLPSKERMSTNFNAMTTPVPPVPNSTLYLDFSKLYLRRLSDDELTIIDTSKKTITYPICSLLMRRNSSLYRNWQEQGNKPVHFIIASSHNAIETVIQICHHSGYVDFLTSGSLSEAELVLINIVGDLFGVENWATISGRINELSRPTLASHSTGTIGRGGTLGKSRGSEARANILNSKEDTETQPTQNSSLKAAQNLLKLKEIKKRQTMKFDIAMLDQLNETEAEPERSLARKSKEKPGGMVNSPSSGNVPTAVNAGTKDANSPHAPLASKPSSNALSLQGLDAADLIANGYLEMNTTETQALIERLNRIYPALVDSLVRQAQAQLATFVSQQASNRRSLGMSGKANKSARVGGAISGGSETASLDDDFTSFPNVTMTASLSDMIAECEKKEAELQRERRKLLREQQELSAQAEGQHSPHSHSHSTSTSGNVRSGGTISVPVKKEKEKASSIFQHFPSKDSATAKSDSAATGSKSHQQHSQSSQDASVSSAGSASGNTSSNVKKATSVSALPGDKRLDSAKSPRVGFKGFQPKDKKSGAREHVPHLTIPANMPQVPLIPDHVVNAPSVPEPVLAEPAEPDLYQEQGDYNLSFFMTYGSQKHVYGSNPATFEQLRAQIQQIFKITEPVHQIRVCYLNEYGDSVQTDSLEALIEANELEISLLS